MMDVETAPTSRIKKSICTCGSNNRTKAVLLLAVTVISVLLLSYRVSYCVVANMGYRMYGQERGEGDKSMRYMYRYQQARVWEMTDRGVLVAGGEELPGGMRIQRPRRRGRPKNRNRQMRLEEWAKKNRRKGGEKRLPTALIIGVKKGGTRALLEFLRLHPDVRGVGPELHFFDRHYNLGLDWYREQMPATLAGQISVEKTPSYFVTKEVPERVHRMNSSIKLVLVLRDPVSRAVSDYTQALSKKTNVKPFESLVFGNESSGLVDTSWGPVKVGLYVKHLSYWLHHFPRKQFHFVSGEGLAKDPAVEMIKLQEFLGLKKIISEKHFYWNATKGFPCLKKSEGRAFPHCLGNSKGRPHPYIDPETITRLKDFYKPFNQKLYSIVGQDFGWG